MAGQRDAAHVRLAELVAALSLGVDLGFGQPMEHVLRQCLIALRLAERLGLDEETRASVYYTALLVNVGCHSDAHEQAKWFGDDIALKATKYDARHRQPASALPRSSGCVGAGNPPLHRLRVGLEFARLGSARHRAHAHAARRPGPLARRTARASRKRARVASAPHTSNGTDGGGRAQLGGEEIPVAARLAQLAEFVEVAHRVGGIDAAKALLEATGREAVRPALIALLMRDDADEILDGSRRCRRPGRR